MSYWLQFVTFRISFYSCLIGSIHNFRRVVDQVRKITLLCFALSRLVNRSVRAKTDGKKSESLTYIHSTDVGVYITYIQRERERAYG